MTEYDVWLYKNKAVQIHRTQIKCDRRDVPGKLARIVLDYLRSAPYPGTMLAMVSVGWNYTAYLIQSNGAAVKVYHQVFQCNMAGVEE